MEETGAASEEEPSPKSSPWDSLIDELRSWTSADRRLLLITVAGGLAVNVLTILIIAMAVAVARAEHSHSFTMALEIVYPIMIGGFLVAVFASKRRRNKSRHLIFVALTAVAFLIDIALILGWVGSAAGIK